MSWPSGGTSRSRSTMATWSSMRAARRRSFASDWAPAPLGGRRDPVLALSIGDPVTHTIILSVGTSSTQIGLMALRQIQARGNPDRASGVFVFAEDPGFFGLDHLPGVR